MGALCFVIEQQRDEILLHGAEPRLLRPLLPVNGQEGLQHFLVVQSFIQWQLDVALPREQFEHHQTETIDVSLVADHAFRCDAVPSRTIKAIDDQGTIVHHRQIFDFDVAVNDSTFHRFVQNIGCKPQDFHTRRQRQSPIGGDDFLQSQAHTHAVDTLDSTGGIVFSNIVERHCLIL